MNELIKKYKIFNDELIEAKKFGIIINEFDITQLFEIIELLNNFEIWLDLWSLL